MTFCECTNSVSIITKENNSFSVTILGHWSSRGGAETLHKLQQLLQLRSKNDTKLHVEEVSKRRNQMKIGDKEYKISDLDTHKEINKELKIAEYNDLEDMVFRMELTYHEFAEIPDTE